MNLNHLTPEEKHVIINKGTEAPGTGEYDKFYNPGIYLCRQCNTPLYDSENKFSSGCGWPSFDAELPNAVHHSPDADGNRTEITCNICGAHLGHVFVGEHFTDKNTRHCVNSISLRFIPLDFLPETTPSAVLAGGCFWCLEAVFKRLKGVLSVTPGYTGGNTPNPSYHAVAEKTTGHAEAIKIEYGPKIISYELLLKVFFTTHDPTTVDRQGNDVGPEYRSEIFYQTKKQKEVAEKIIADLTKDKTFSKPIVTTITPLIKFYPAESEHFDYYDKNRGAPYCQIVIDPKIAKLKKEFEQYLK